MIIDYDRLMDALYDRVVDGVVGKMQRGEQLDDQAAAMALMVMELRSIRENVKVMSDVLWEVYGTE